MCQNSCDGHAVIGSRGGVTADSSDLGAGWTVCELVDLGMSVMVVRIPELPAWILAN